MAKVFFLGAPTEPPGSELTVPERFKATGQNTGNLLIGASLREQLVVNEFAGGTHHNPNWVNETFDLIAIPAANFIFRGFDFGMFASYIERTQLPCLMVGIGAQAPSARTAELEVPEGTRRFLKVVSERTGRIGVRGAFSADVCRALGVDNVQITGCPSLYRAQRPDLKVRRKPWTENMRVSVNGSHTVIGHASDPSAAKEVERQLLEYAVEGALPYVLQNEMPEIEIVADPAVDRASYEAALAPVLARFGGSVTPSAYFDHLRRNGRVFFDLENWDNFIRTQDFSIGSRFHGNLIALSNGVAAAVLVHDSRTTEMCEFARIPHVPIAAVGALDPRVIYEGLDLDGFERNYEAIYRDYVGFLDANGVRHRLDAGNG